MKFRLSDKICVSITLLLTLAFFNGINSQEEQENGDGYTDLDFENFVAQENEESESERDDINEQDHHRRLQQMYVELLQNGTNLESCERRPLSISPSLLSQLSTTIPASDFYYDRNRLHKSGAETIKKLLVVQEEPEDLICLAKHLRDHTGVNRGAWLRGVLGAMAERTRVDLGYLRAPLVAEMVPSLFVKSAVIDHAIKKRKRRDAVPKTCTVLDGSLGEVNGVENKLWYFREDLLLNAAHWYWHLSNPFSHVRMEVGKAPRPDRRGELFYYFHWGIHARYHAERLGEGMADTEGLELKKDTVLREGYKSGLTDVNSRRSWTDRAANTKLEDLVSNRDFINHPANISINERLEYLRRIEEAIQKEALIDRTGRHIKLDSYSGIDLLSEVTEASIYSINPDYYSEFGPHNDGHFLIGLISDPADKLQLPPGVMADGATSMRDPLFYRYHLPVAQLFDQHKTKLEPYKPHGGEWELSWPEVEVQHIHVEQDGSPLNQLTTFMNYKKLNIVKGLDFNRSASDSQSPVYVCAQHLDHKPFTYNIVIERSLRRASAPHYFHINHKGVYGSHEQIQELPKKATIRLFLAPRYNQKGRRYKMEEQRKLFFPLDHFTVDLKLGLNKISRSSLESLLTLPWEQTYEEIETGSEHRLTPYCGCGWPQHLLLPKGNGKGQVFDLFIMATDAEADWVTKGKDTDQNQRLPTKRSCRAAHIYCGIAGQLYPDKRPMNYPFDRMPYAVGDKFTFSSWQQGPFGNTHPRARTHMVQNLDEYHFGIPNMDTVQVTIRHDSSSEGLKSSTKGGGLPTIPLPATPTTPQFPNFGHYGQDGGGGGDPYYGKTYHGDTSDSSSSE